MQKINVLVPPLRAVPDGAAVIADAAAWLLGSHPGWRALTGRIGGLRRRLAASASDHREARSRGLLVAMARRYESTQPGFAKDLYAAAAAADYRKP